MPASDGQFDYSELKQRDVCLCSFSMGKDSLATYLEVKPHFKRVIPFYLYSIPNLSFIEDNLKYYEDKLGEHIWRLPQPKFYNMLNTLMYQPPDEDRHALIKSWQLPKFTHDDVHVDVCELGGVDPETTFTALGLKYADSIQRRTSLARNGLISWNKKKFYPIAYYNKQDVIDKIKGAGWKLPTDYRYFSDSFDGLQIKYVLPIREHFPNDWEKIKELFPLIELEILRYERSLKC
jgi:hypothetical protein